jgi:succinate dehydrogenase/fumarate reductase flavoprotein subunit
MLKHLRTAEFRPLPRDPDFMAKAEVSSLMARTKGENVANIRAAMQEVMMDKVSRGP